MRTSTLRVLVVVAAVLAFPLAASAQNQVNMSFGNQLGMSIQCTNAFESYWGSSTVYFSGTSATDWSGSPSPVFKALGVSPYSLTSGMRPTICVQFNPQNVPTTGSYSAWITANYGFGYSSQYSWTVYATANFDPPSGFVNPKFVILGVTYAPPGNRSNVTYATNTAVGFSSSVSNSFTAGTSTTVSRETSAAVKGVGSFGESTSATISYSQTLDTSSSIALNQTTSNSTSLAGFTDPVSGVNHDYDQIFVWLNPILKFKAASNWIQWSGYDWDMRDPIAPDMDVIAIPIGCLNGHFQSNSMASTCNAIISGPLQRSWAQPNVDGSGPGLTGGPYCVPGSGSDLCTLMAADPFSDPNYTFTPPSSGYTTADGRFTACNNGHCFSNVLFQPNITNSYSQTYSSSTSQSAGFNYTVGFSFDTTSTADFTGLFKQTLKTSTSLSFKHSYSVATSASNSSTGSFSIVGPDAGYTGPMQFVVYQDNLYGTFMFKNQ